MEHLVNCHGEWMLLFSCISSLPMLRYWYKPNKEGSWLLILLLVSSTETSDIRCSSTRAEIADHHSSNDRSVENANGSVSRSPVASGCNFNWRADASEVAEADGEDSFTPVSVATMPRQSIVERTPPAGQWDCGRHLQSASRCGPATLERCVSQVFLK